MSAEIQSIRIFIAYSSKDLEFQKELKNHLEPLVRNKRIVVMDNYAINPGDNWDEKIGLMLEQSDIVLLLLSADALASPHFFREAGIAIEQRRQGRTDIIPVKLRPCDLEDEPLLQELDLLEVLPEKDVPVVKWQHRDEAYLSIVQGLKRVLRVREEAFVAREQRLERQREYADLISQADVLMKKKKWREAKTLLDKALKMWEKSFKPGREATEKLQKQCAAEIETIEKAKRKILEQQETERKKRELEAADARAREKAEKKKREEEARKKRKQEETEKRKREEAERKRREQAQRDAYLADLADLMIPIKGGTFDMGSNKDDSEKPIHRVTVKDFYLCKYPVTQVRWNAIMGYNPSRFKGDDLPVVNVSCSEAERFIEKLNEKTGKRYRLPSEAEWEYAARGGTQSKGYKYAGSNNLKEVGWYGGYGGYGENENHPVGQKKANELGLFDMSGNVWEWCKDDWHYNYKGDPPVDGSAWTSGDDSSRRVVRGGAYNCFAEDCRVASRRSYHFNTREYYSGFRLAR